MKKISARENGLWGLTLRRTLFSVCFFLLSQSMSTPAFSQTLGQKNNNPINLKGSHYHWKGAAGRDRFGHVYFKSLNYGIRAGLKNLKTAQKRYPNRTLHNYLSTRFAEKNGATEARYIAKKLKISPHAQLKHLDMAQVLIPLAQFESGIRLTPLQVREAGRL